MISEETDHAGYQSPNFDPSASSSRPSKPFVEVLSIAGCKLCPELRKLRIPALDLRIARLRIEHVAVFFKTGPESLLGKN